MVRPRNEQSNSTSVNWKTSQNKCGMPILLTFMVHNTIQSNYIMIGKVICYSQCMILMLVTEWPFSFTIKQEWAGLLVYVFNGWYIIESLLKWGNENGLMVTVTTSVLTMLLLHHSSTHLSATTSTAGHHFTVPQFYSKLCNFCAEERTLCISAPFF